jgi:hypothetical protein
VTQTRRAVVGEQLDELRTDLEALWVAVTRDPKKEARKERVWMLLTAGLGAVAALGARQVATRVWVVLTGESPPFPQAKRPPRRR